MTEHRQSCEGIRCLGAGGRNWDTDDFPFRIDMIRINRKGWGGLMGRSVCQEGPLSPWSVGRGGQDWTPAQAWSSCSVGREVRTGLKPKREGHLCCWGWKLTPEPLPHHGWLPWWVWPEGAGQGSPESGEYGLQGSQGFGHWAAPPQREVFYRTMQDQNQCFRCFLSTFPLAPKSRETCIG